MEAITPEPAHRKQVSLAAVLWTLAVLNVVLLMSYAVKLTSSTATAQYRRPADYLMIPGQVIGGNGEAIYVVDTTDGYLGAMQFDDTRGRLDVMQPINLNQVFSAAMGTGR